MERAVPVEGQSLTDEGWKDGGGGEPESSSRSARGKERKAQVGLRALRKDSEQSNDAPRDQPTSLSPAIA